MKRALVGGAEPPSFDEVTAGIEKRLFVGQLPISITEDAIRAVYEPFGNLSEIRALSGKRVAFVSFTTWASAHKALLATDAQDGIPGIDNATPLAVSFAERKGKGSNKGGGAAFAKGLQYTRIFVGGLPPTCTDAELQQVFETFGEIERATLLPAKSQFRCGYVNFSLWGEALDAIESLNGQMFPGNTEKPMSIVFAKPLGGGGGEKQRRTDAPNVPESASRSGASWDFEHLKSSYIAAVDGDAPAHVCDDLHRKIMSARLAYAPAWSATSPAPAWSAHAPETGDEKEMARLFIGGLPADCADEDLKALVEQVQFRCGPAQSEMLECRVLPGKGCGYVRFASQEASEQAIEELNERIVDGWPTPMRVKYATSKAVKQQQAQTVGTRFVDTSGYVPAMQVTRPAMPAWSSWVTPPGGVAISSEGWQDEASVKAQGLDPSRLFVGQLSREIGSKDALFALFSSYGAVHDIRWLEDKGVAYITFNDFASANTALENLKGQNVPGLSREQGLNISFSKLRGTPNNIS